MRILSFAILEIPIFGTFFSEFWVYISQFWLFSRNSQFTSHNYYFFFGISEFKSSNYYFFWNSEFTFQSLHLVFLTFFRVQSLLFAILTFVSEFRVYNQMMKWWVYITQFRFFFSEFRVYITHLLLFFGILSINRTKILQLLWVFFILSLHLAILTIISKFRVYISAFTFHFEFTSHISDFFSECRIYILQFWPLSQNL